MDYRQKMVVAPQQKIKIESNDDDDEDDLEALRLAALQSLRTKDTGQHKKQCVPQLQKAVSQVTQASRAPYKCQRLPRRGHFHNRLQQRQNGNLYYQMPRNPNLIAIVPVEEHPVLQQPQIKTEREFFPIKIEKTDASDETPSDEVTKFHRFKDTGSCSEEEDVKEHKKTIELKEDTREKDDMDTERTLLEDEDKADTVNSPQRNGEDDEEVNDDDDDILLMADLEEEDSLERLMDEMEREMNVDKPSDKREKRNSKRDSKDIEKGGKEQDQKIKTEEHSGKKENCNSTVTSVIVPKSERRSVSPHMTARISQKRRSLSPKLRPRKKSPRRSPRRSPIRQLKKSQRETARYRSPRMSPPRFSPRSRSPKLSPRARSPRFSPRRSPNRSPVRRSPLRKLSPRGRSPKVSPHSRSPRLRSSRSPRISSRSKSPRPLRSPKISRSRSPRPLRSRSPRLTPHRLTPQPPSPRSKSPRLSPRRTSPIRRPSSPRSRSPKLSPRRISPRLRSPKLSPRRSPWSSPRNSPRLSPRRRRLSRSPPKELLRKHVSQSLSADSAPSPLYVRDTSPIVKVRASPEANKAKIKQRDEGNEKGTVADEAKDSNNAIYDPVLEARRKKFQSTRPIDPINANKKIKLSKKDDANKKVETQVETDLTHSIRKVKKVSEDYDIEDVDLNLSNVYNFEEMEDMSENTSPIAITSSINTCIDIESSKSEKDRSSKKKKKRDKEIYQVGKLKNELPLSERIGKDKKCKKRKDITMEQSSEDAEPTFEDTNVDEEGDLRTELSRRRAERLNRTVPIQSARLVQSAFKGVVKEVVKNNAKVNQRHVVKSDEKSNQKDIRRVTVLHRPVSELHDSEDESALDSKVPVRFRLGLNKQAQESRETKVSRKSSKRQGRKE